MHSRVRRVLAFCALLRMHDRMLASRASSWQATKSLGILRWDWQEGAPQGRLTSGHHVLPRQGNKLALELRT